MKFTVCLTLFALIGGAAAETPMARTVQLIRGLSDEIKKDGTAEQASFDSYACWCEKTMERKANDISAAKELITETNILIKKLKGEIASHGAEIDQLNKDIAQNREAVKEAKDVRDKENKDYMNERTESEQCIGALEAAVKALTGAGGSGKKVGFLETPLHQAELMSVMVGVKKALNHHSSASLSDKDIELMKHFVTKPDDFVGANTHTMSAAQISQNPFGDYAPQSGQIQGILKSMYDSFTSDLEKANAEEADSQKSFLAIFGTKMQELETLEATLQTQETNSAAKTKRLSESEVLLDDTTAQLEADEAFFADTKEACQAKATEWSVRTRLRTEELQGMDTAINILSSESAKKTFKASVEGDDKSFLQVSAVHKHGSERVAAYNKLKVLASQLGSRSVAKIAVAIQAGGHFDKVIAMIDDMIVLLRKEEQSDIEHRDRCENSENANANEMADNEANIKKTEGSIKRMETEKKDLEGEIGELEKEIGATNADMAELLKFRNKEVAEFRQELKDDSDAVSLLKQAIVALSEFYKRNKIDAPALLQKSPEYAQDADKAPETSWSKSDSRKSETGGILAILGMLVEDTEKEMKEGRADNDDAQEKYLKQNGALQNTLDAQTETKVNTEKELADLEEKISTYEDHKDSKEADQAAEEDSKKAIGTDCSWVKTHFQSRRDKRKDEIDGLVDAKASLAGAGTGTYLD